jgi:hypothetical protein
MPVTRDKSWRFVFLVLLVGCTPPSMQRISIAPDHQHFMLASSGERFVPWGHNYAAQGLEDLSGRSWEKIESDLLDLRQMRANVVRIHLQFALFMDEPGKPNRAALARLSQLLNLAERHGIYLDITGLASYRKDQRAPWYDALGDQERWAAQATFWEAVAETCAHSPAVFCYDLMNEPIVAGQRKDGWYTGEFGGYEFLQRLSLDQSGRPLDDIAVAWTRTLVTAIRKRDSVHLITVGMLPAWGPSQKAIGPMLDFIAVHIYPERGKVADAMATLKRFDIGKPIVIEETFPLSCGVAEEREFLLQSRTMAAGWMGQYPEESLAELKARQRAGTLTPAQASYLAWLELFREVGPRMLAVD